MKINFSLTLVLIVIYCHDVSAQKRWNNQNAAVSPWEIGLSGGVSSFITSINPGPGAPKSQINYWNSDLNPGVGLSLVRNISPAIGIELNWLNTKLTGTWNDKWEQIGIGSGHETPLTFDSQINQFDMMVAFNVNQMMLPGDDEDQWHIYLKTGVGVAHIKDNKNFFPGDSPYTKLSFALDPGVSVSIGDHLKLLVGSTVRAVNTDNLDGVHVATKGTNGKVVSWMKVYEIYDYTYLRLNYRLGDWGQKKSRSTFRSKHGKFKIYRRR